MKIIAFNQLKKLSDLVGFGFAMHFLKIDLLVEARSSIDVVAGAARSRRNPNASTSRCISANRILAGLARTLASSFRGSIRRLRYDSDLGVDVR
jgi:hypothetical protein